MALPMARSALVADVVAVAVVDRLEAVHVDHQQRALRILPVRLGHFPLGVVDERARVGQAGQRVGQRVGANLLEDERILHHLGRLRRHPVQVPAGARR